VHIRQSEVAARVAISESFVIETQTVQHGGVQVMHADGILGGSEAQFVGGSVCLATANPASCQPDRKAPVIVVSTGLWFSVGGKFDGRGAAEFAAPEDEGVVEHAALLEIGNECGDGLIDLCGEAAVSRFDVGVIVPRLTGPVPELHVADPAFQQSAGDESLTGMCT